MPVQSSGFSVQSSGFGFGFGFGVLVLVRRGVAENEIENQNAER